MPDVLQIRERPPHLSVVALLEAEGLPASDLTETHLEHFFFTGSDGAPSALVGLEIYCEAALLRSPTSSTEAIGASIDLERRPPSNPRASSRDLPASIRFYRILFGAEPVVTQPDYAK